MKKNVFLIICIAFLSSFEGMSQQKQAYTPSPLHEKQGLGNGEIIDTTHLRVWYSMNADSIADMNTYIDYQCLDIGEKFSRYYSWFVFNNDSLLKEWHKKHPKAGSSPKWLGPGGRKKNTWIQYAYADLYFHDGELTEYACMPLHLDKYNSQYSEPIPRQRWIVTFETQKLLGYICQKATCHFRGRDYVAWFAPDIPIQQGPWKLRGLPGLILKAHDADSLYTFEAVKIETGEFPILRYEYKDYKEESREKVQKMQRSFTENWYKAVDFHRVEILPNGKAEMKESVSIYTPYKPLELE